MTTKSTLLLTFAVLSAGFARSQCSIQQQSVSGTNVICSGTGSVTVANTETGVNYYLRDNSNNAIVAGPLEGTGSSVTFNTGIVTAPTTYNVNAVEATDALDFNSGVTQYVSVGTGINSALNGTSQITAEAWIKLESYAWYPTIIGNYGANQMQFLLRVDEGKPAFWIGNQFNNWQRAYGTNYIPLNTWVHLAGTWDGSTIKVYVNGVLAASAAHSGNFFMASQEVRIGASSTSEIFNGRIDNVRVWNTVKSDTEINNNKSICLTGSEANLLAYYDFENISGATLNDLTANNFDGTLVNAPAIANGTEFCLSCSLQMASTTTISVAPLTAQNLTANSASLTCSGLTTVGLTSSDAGASYFLRDNSNNNIVAGPVFGTGGAISLNTNTNATTTYNVYAKKGGAVNLTGTALSLDGVDDYVNIPGSTTDLTNGDFTLEAWVNTTGINEGLLTKSDASGWQPGEKCFYIDGLGRPSFVGWGNDFIVGGTVVNDGTWHHVAVTWNYSTSTGKIYVDGMETTIIDNYQPNLPDNVGNTLKLGAPNYAEATNYFSGMIDEVRIWNTTRSASQLSSNMTSCLFGNEPNLVAYYQFENETSTSATDLTGGAENGVLMNASTTPWMTGIGCGTVCDITMSTLYTTTVAPIADKVVSPATSSLTCVGNVAVTVANTDAGIGYFLRDDANDNIVSGPFYGNGSTGTLNTGNITSSATYNVFATHLSALQFDGQNDYLESPAITISRLFTYETWIKTNDPSPEWSGIITTSTVSGSGMFSQLAMSPSGTLRWESNFPNSFQDMTTVINNNVWHHIAVVSDGNTLTFYVDGNIEHSMSFVAGSFERKMLFMSERMVNSFTSGIMDEARIWNVARTQSQIQAGMSTCISGTEPGLLINYNFENNPQSGVVTDIAGDTQNGTLYNMDLSKVWVDGSSACSSCSMELTNKAIVTVNGINDQLITSSPSSLCNSGSSNIVVPTSDASVTYTLRNDLNDTIVAGPVNGNGGALSMNTGMISATTTYNVYAERIADSHDALSIPNNTYVSVPSGINIANQSFTVEFWGKRNTNNTYDFMVGHGSSSTNNGLHIGFRDNNSFTFAFWGNDLDVTTPANTDGNFHHWSCVYNAGVSGTDRYIYLDGTLIASDDATGDFTGNGVLNIGATPNGTDQLNGEIDELRIWNVARTQSEIQNDMNKCVLPNTTGLLAYYDMTPTGSATVLADKSGNNANGTFVNLDASAFVTDGPAITCTYCQAEMSQTATVTVNSSTTSNITVTECDSYTAPDGAVYTSTGIQTAVINNMAGCDSTITIDLTINNSTASTMTVSECDNYMWTANGMSYTSGGIYTATLTNAAGCDSIVTLDLTITNSTASTMNVASCGSYIWSADGNTYSNAGTFMATLTNAAGCDSIVTLNLSINSVDATTTTTGVTITANSATASYAWLNCDDQTLIVNETSQSFTALFNGNYAAVVTENGCTDTSACVTISSVSIAEAATANENLVVYPNPTSGSINISRANEFNNVIVQLMTIEGKVSVIETKFSGNNLNIDITGFASGIYFMELIEKEKTTRIKVIKN
ncbi:MAG: hypothetical protein K0Q95_2167 [Bacteroidota bacterium]|jgi:hypothetical protein|nr:hypothetical protein [Bacteroidota bacterium]